MNLMALFLVIVAVAVVTWCIRRYIPMDAEFKQIILIVAIAVVVLLLLSAFGVLDAVRGVRVPRVGGN